MPPKKDLQEILSLISSRLNQGVFLLTSAEANHANGCPVLWVSRASFRPLLVAVFVHPKRFTYELILKSGAFCLNILARSSLELARKMGSTSGRKKDKFRGLAWHKGESGAPILDKGIIGYIDCRLQATFPAGDHVCLLGKVVDASITGKEKPLYYKAEDFYKETS